MKVVEYRIPMPLTVEEFQIGQLWSIAEASVHETGGGEGVEILVNTPFDNVSFLGGRFRSGQYTYKIYHMASKVPGIVRQSAPKGSLDFHEESWNAYPYSRTIISNPAYMKENFAIIIESIHIPNDYGQTENALGLTQEKLAKREVVHIDIALDPVKKDDYKEEEDPTLIRIAEAGRGPLGRYWQRSTSPVMTCYKLVTVEFRWFGLQGRMESFIQRGERRVFTKFHRQIFCWMDKWHGLTLVDIRAIEDENQRKLDELRRTGTVRGTRASTGSIEP